MTDARDDGGFAALGVNDHLLGQIEALGMVVPTPVQAAAIPPALAGRDVLGLAQTGTGKTAAYGLPLVQRLMAIGKPPFPGTVRALVLAPTRELATQIAATLKGFAKFTHVKVVLATGGASMARQAERIAPGVDILVATPGRLIDLMKRETAELGQVRNLVLDEADHMLALGFLPFVTRIAEALPERRQVLLFSATMPAGIEALAEAWLRDPVRVGVAAEGAPVGRPAEGIVQELRRVSQRDKETALRGLLTGGEGRTLVFVRTRERAEKVAGLLVRWGFAAAAIHGDRTPAQRSEALRGFRSGALRVLVATDLAARGLDIPEVALVVNLDVAGSAEAHVHRIGRTARAGAAGLAITFCAPAEAEALAAIEETLGPLPALAPAEAPPLPEPRRPARRPSPRPRRR